MESSKHYRNSGIVWVVICYGWAFLDVYLGGGIGDGLSGGIWFLWVWGTVNLVAAVFHHTMMSSQKRIRDRMRKLVEAYVEETRNLARVRGESFDECVAKLNQERRSAEEGDHR